MVDKVMAGRRNVIDITPTDSETSSWRRTRSIPIRYRQGYNAKTETSSANRLGGKLVAVRSAASPPMEPEGGIRLRGEVMP